MTKIRRMAVAVGVVIVLTVAHMVVFPGFEVATIASAANGVKYTVWGMLFGWVFGGKT